MTLAIYIVLILICASVSFLLSGMETGVFSLNRLRIRQQMRTGQAQAKILFNYYREPERFFWTILVGNTLANAAIITLLVTLLNQHLAKGWFWPRFFLACWCCSSFAICCRRLCSAHSPTAFASP